ncbi:MAG: DUF493 family protein [Fluviicola sp.]|jgi:hypothetical protein
MSEDVFAKLREQLELQEWPGVYFFKFIVPNNPDSIENTKSLFSKWAEITQHKSKTGKYISISAKQFMESVEAIIDIYNRAQNIPGIISL